MSALSWASVGFQGVLFDCDGVLVDSDASVERAWRRWAKAYGLPVDVVLGMVHGRRSADTVALLIEGPDQAQALRLVNELELEDAWTVKEIPGASAILHDMPPTHWAVVTSGMRALATARLDGAGLPRPSVLIPAEDVVKGKPAPDGYLMAAERLMLLPAQTVVIEDSPSGIAAARAAGSGLVIGVGDRSKPARPDLVIEDLRQIRWRCGHLEVAEPA